MDEETIWLQNSLWLPDTWCLVFSRLIFSNWYLRRGMPRIFTSQNISIHFNYSKALKLNGRNKIASTWTVNLGQILGAYKSSARQFFYYFLGRSHSDWLTSLFNDQQLQIKSRLKILWIERVTLIMISFSSSLEMVYLLSWWPWRSRPRCWPIVRTSRLCQHHPVKKSFASIW